MVAAAVSCVLREHRTADQYLVTRLDLRACLAQRGHEAVGPRAESDEAEPVTLLHAIARFRVGDDTARDQARDLTHQEPSMRSANADRRLLVVDARLLVSGVQKLALVVMHQLDRAVDRIAVYMHVEHGQE